MELNERLLVCYRKMADCIENGTKDEVKTLFQVVKNLSSLVDNTGSTLLHYAVRYGNSPLVQHLIEAKHDVNAKDYSGITPLMLAVQNADATILDILLRSNARVLGSTKHLVKVRDMVGLAVECLMNTTLIPGRQKQQLILEVLFDKINGMYSSVDRFSGMFLRSFLEKFTVVVFGNVQMAEIVLIHDYPVDFQEPTRGYTALHWTIIFAKFENAKLLIKYNANTCAVNNSGFTPLHYYTWNFEAVDTDSEVLRSFLQCNPDFYLPDERGVTQVDHLLKYGQKKTKDAVIKVGFDMLVNYKYVIEKEQQEEVVKFTALLLQNGLDAQHVFTDGMTLIDYLLHRVNVISVLISMQHLALIGSIDQGFLLDCTRDAIESVQGLPYVFDLFVQKLESMKNIVVRGTVTLFKMLTESQDKLINYTRNQDFIPCLDLVIQRAAAIEDLPDYYTNTIRKRVSDALEIVSFETRVASIIQALTGIGADAYHDIVYKIIGYLGLQDRNNLCRAVGNHLCMVY